MKAVCPNSEEHNEFYTVAHVIQSWKVDNQGELIEIAETCIHTSFGPNKHNTWKCAVCGAQANVTD